MAVNTPNEKLDSYCLLSERHIKRLPIFHEQDGKGVTTETDSGEGEFSIMRKRLDEEGDEGIL